MPFCRDTWSPLRRTCSESGSRARPGSQRCELQDRSSSGTAAGLAGFRTAASDRDSEAEKRPLLVVHDLRSRDARSNHESQCSAPEWWPACAANSSIMSVSSPCAPHRIVNIGGIERRFCAGQTVGKAPPQMIGTFGAHARMALETAIAEVSCGPPMTVTPTASHVALPDGPHRIVRRSLDRCCRRVWCCRLCLPCKRGG